MAKGMKKKNKIVKNEEIKEEAELNNKKVKKHKKFNVKKNLGRLIALIVVICMLLASSATLIFYLMWYLQ